MSSFQGVGIEEFHCIQKCTHFNGLEERGSTVYRGILISGSWNRGVPLYTEVYSFQWVGRERFHCIQSFQGVGIEEFHCIQRCPHFRVLE